jgi:hypothetical protein
MVCFTLLLGCSAPATSSDDTSEVQRILDDPRYDWISVGTPHTRVYLAAGSFAAKNRDLLPARAEESRRFVLDRLDEPDYASTTHLFYVDSRADMERLVGLPVTGFAYFDEQAVVLVFNSTWQPFERHEMTHVVTLGTWPDPAGPAVVEGLATYVDGFCGGYENGRIARTMLDMETLLPLETLTGSFRQQDDLVAYLQAAATIEFAVERLGAGVIRTIWERGGAAVPELLDFPSPGDFVLLFEAWLSSTYDPVPSESWDAILEHGCGIDSRPDQ